jgi:hypothetical protein
MPPVLFFDSRNVFEPDRIEKLAAVFKDILGSISETDFATLSALTIRKTVAASLMDEARRGECDATRLKAAALGALRALLPPEPWDQHHFPPPESSGFRAAAFGR